MSRLLPPKEAKQKGKEKEQMILFFFHQEIFSNIHNVASLLKLAKNHTYTILHRMVKKGLLSKHVLELETGSITLWGITQLGIEEAGHVDTAPLYGFTPSRVSLVTLNHTLMTQRVYIALKHLKWTQWLNADRHTFKEAYPTKHRPDAIVKTPSGDTIAIETELTLKTPLRYRDIMKSHVLATQKGYWDHVIYVVRSDNAKKMLKRRFDNIKYVQFEESKHPFEKYQPMVSIFTIDEIPILNQKR